MLQVVKYGCVKTQPYSNRTHLPSRKADITVFARLPIEIVQAICEIAASSHHNTAALLCRVSKLIFRCVFPILYRTVFLRNKRDCVAFTTALNVSRFYQVAVKDLYIPIIPTAAGFAPFITHGVYPNLKRLALPSWALNAVFPSTEQLVSLTHLTIYQETWSNHPIPSNIIFESVTHLVIPPIVLSSQLERRLALFPNVTHFATPLRYTRTLSHVSSHQTSLLCSLGVLTRCRLIALLLFTIEDNTTVPKPVRSEDINHEEVLRQAQVESDPRYVVIPDQFYDGSVWKSWREGTESIWEAAEQAWTAKRKSARILRLNLTIAIIERVSQWTFGLDTRMKP